MRSGTAPLARHRTPSDVPCFPLRYTGGPVVHHAPCQPQRTVAVSDENGQAHMVRTIALSVVPFDNSCLYKERGRSGPPKGLTKTRFPDELKDDPSAVCDFRAILESQKSDAPVELGSEFEIFDAFSTRHP
ncbi:hypothetical protein ALC57_17072 [Trachymyrmex cornetzi]|uniref:Uncharacterized protein n=1 Tax=Trachymyrmex cornetzi TaxID=471704 RepID=A0A151ITW0_9HYME|nr:hypothetical protein ALC57_17072 [Trachymyrmex cornetzi]